MTAFKREYPVHPCHMSLFPTKDSVAEAILYIESQAPLHTANDIFPLLMMFQNTILKVLNEDQP